MNPQQHRRNLWPRVLAAIALAVIGSATQAATITVNSLLDDVFPDATGAIFDVGGAPVTLAASKCTLRMAIASANLDLAVGGTNGCVAGDSESNVSLPNGYADVIVFTSGLTGTINLNVSKLMSEAPAVYRNSLGVAAPNATSALVVSRPLNMTGNTVGATLTPGITLDGGLLANAAVNGRIMVVSDGDNASDMRVAISALAFANGRTVSNAGGCLFSRESLTISYSSFTNCLSDGDSVTGQGYGGALGVFTARNTTVATNPTPQSRPSLTLTSVTFSNNKALRNGATTASGAGAIALGFSTGYVGHVVMNGVTISGNQSDNFGGVVIRNAQSVSIVNSDIIGNSASGARDAVTTTLNSGFSGGMQIRNGGVVSIVNTRINNNSAGQQQGGLEVRDSASLHASDLTVTGNSASSAVAATYVSEAGMRILNVTNVTGTRWNVSNNVLTGDSTSGGAVGGLGIQGAAGTTMLRDIVVSGNTCTNASDCALRFNDNGTLIVQGIKSKNNVATKAGSPWTGGAGFSLQRNANVRISDAEISGNITGDTEVVSLRATFRDYSGNPAVPVTTLPPTTNTLLIENSTINNNTAQGSFIVYLAEPGIFTFRNVTIASNTVGTGCGGGINIQAYNPFSASNATQVIVQNSTIARNTVAQCQTAIGFGAYTGSANGPVNGSLIVESSILGREAAGGTKDVIGASDPSKVTLTRSLVEDNAGLMSAQCGANGNLCNTNPLLDALALNGGPTPTMRLLPGSPALNVGSNPANLTTDQRGAARVVGASADMGALESAPMAAGNCNLDMDGDNLLNANKEGLVLLRAMLGFTGAATTVGTGITAAQWNSARPLINTNCGTSFAP